MLNSRRARQEFFSGAALLAGALGMAVWGWRLPPVPQIVGWVVLAVAAAILMRRGWFTLFGPVLFYDMVCQARRTRYFVVRLSYAALLIFFLFITYLEINHWPAQQQHVKMAESFFFKFIIIQFVAVALLTPAYVGGAVAEEKERKTLEFMLVTDLRNREIVLSKLLSRLANLTLFVLTGLPILSCLQFLGGIDPNLLLAGFLATFMTMFGLAGFSIFASVHLKRSRDAVVISYLAPLVYLLIGYLSLLTVRTFTAPIAWGGMTFAEAVDLLNTGNLPLAIYQVMSAIGAGTIEHTLWPVLRSYMIFQGLVGLACVLAAVARLRKVALRQASEAPRQPRLRLRQHPAVWDSALLWKELFVDDRPRRSWLMRVLVGILVLITVGWIVAVMLDDRLGDHDAAHAVTIVGTLVACLMILSAAVRAAGCIVGERDRDTFDFLLTTPLGSQEILWAKFLGCLLSLRRPMIWLGTIWGLGVVSGALTIWELPVLLLPLLVYASVFIIVGLWFSMVCRSTTRATVATVMTSLGISGGHWLLAFCCLAASHGPGAGVESIFKFQAGMTPPFVIGMSHFAGFELRHHGGSGSEFGDLVAFCIVGLVVYSAAGLIFWGAVLSPRFEQITNREPGPFPGIGPHGLPIRDGAEE